MSAKTLRHLVSVRLGGVDVAVSFTLTLIKCMPLSGENGAIANVQLVCTPLSHSGSVGTDRPWVFLAAICK